MGEISSNSELLREYPELARSIERTVKLATKASLLWRKRHFESADIVLWAWKARQMAREAGLPTPDWVERYLDEVAVRLLEINPKMPAKDRRGAVEKALLLGGQVGKATGLMAFARHERDLEIAQAVLDRIELKQTLRSAADEIAKEKSTLVKHLPKSGLAVLNADDPRVVEMQTPASKLTYGVQNQAMLMASDISATSKSLRFTATYKHQSHEFIIPVIGEFQVYVLLPAIAVGLSMGMTLFECAEALKALKLPQGRMNPIDGVNHSHIIDSSYNSSPITVDAALDLLGGLRAKRKIAALGMMNELGEMSYEAHITMGEKAAQVSDLIFAVGQEAPIIKKGAMVGGMKEENIFTFFDARDAGLSLADKLESGDLVLVKGSQNMVRMERLVKEIMKDPGKASELLCRQGEAWEKR